MVGKMQRTNVVVYLGVALHVFPSKHCTSRNMLRNRTSRAEILIAKACPARLMGQYRSDLAVFFCIMITLIRKVC